MTGIAAVAISAAFTSCSKETTFEQITPEMISEANYENAFVSRFGEIASNQDWGFGQFKKGASARTRVIDVNGNLWEETPECTAAEAAAVFAYVNKDKSQVEHYTERFPKNIANYFVTQVYTGTDTYNSVDGTNTGTLGSAHMDHLNIAMDNTASLNNGSLSGNWNHINNFNASDNRNWGGNTLVNDGGTLDFAYNCSEDSRYHNRFIVIDGQYINDADGVNHAGKYYVCFDFIGENPEAETVFQVPGVGSVTIKGAYASTAEAIAAGATGEVWVSYNSETGTNTYETRPVTSDWVWESVRGGNKVYNSNNVYTDWIVRIVEAQPAEEEKEDDFPAADVRVLAEDLDVTDTFNGEKYEGDFDFNDAVFDVVYDYKGTTWIVLQAAGGTYPLYVDGHEIHAAFGCATNDMVNTSGSKKNPVRINLEKSYTDANEIPVTVDLPSGTRTLTAGVGKAPHKLAVDKDFQWMSERTSIETLYPLFGEWVKHADTKWY